MGTTQGSVLVLADEPLSREAIRAALAARGLRVCAADDPGRAGELMGHSAPRVVIVDESIPPGADLLSLAGRRARVILLSEQLEAEGLSRAIRRGVYELLIKPCSPEEVAEVACRAAAETGTGGPLAVRAAEALRQLPEMRQTALRTVQTLVRAVEAKDPYTSRHSEQVTSYSVQLARRMGLPERLVEALRVAALLHDVGKIGVPDRLLTKPGRLTDREFEHIRRHPLLGAEILQNLPFLDEEIGLVRWHHERWDGRGYPDGLAGDRIPLGARVLNATDSIDAMLMARAYKEPYPLSRVIEELRLGAGSQFDPDVSAAAVRLCQECPEMPCLAQREQPTAARG